MSETTSFFTFALIEVRISSRNLFQLEIQIIFKKPSTKYSLVDLLRFGLYLYDRQFNFFVMINKKMSKFFRVRIDMFRTVNCYHQPYITRKSKTRSAFFFLREHTRVKVLYLRVNCKQREKHEIERDNQAMMYLGNTNKSLENEYEKTYMAHWQSYVVLCTDRNYNLDSIDQENYNR